MAHEIDELVTQVMGNPLAFQLAPWLFFRG